jgi:Domain of unknown function (DUF4349)
MTTLAQSLGTIRKPWQWAVLGGGLLLVWMAVALPNMTRSRESANLAVRSEPQLDKQVGDYAMRIASTQMASSAQVHTLPMAAGVPKSPAIDERKVIRTSSMTMIVQHPDEVTQKITALADALGGYLVSSDSGGENATAATLTIRVPAARFEEARTEIRKLGLRLENEKVEAEDVTRQYVDQDATIRNLRAEEAGYLFILKKATTVKDMLAVSEELSNVRGQIEQQQAEFNALSKQIETVALSISLKTQAEERVLGLNWRPLYQIKLAMRDGMESVANYATAMVSVLFYLPAVVLWTLTIVFGALGAWRAVYWGGRRWLGWKNAPQAPIAQA